MNYVSDDASAATAELFNELALRSKKPEGPPASGVCLTCGEPLSALRRWCDPDCRDTWEKLNARGA